jgi:ubiquinone/menaquinone biosynthesis C-methylase UbiE
MSFYEEKILPHIINCGCSNEPIMKLRAQIVPLAKGQVLEVGMGSGLNLALYDSNNVEQVWGLEPSLGMRHKARKNLAAAAVKVNWLNLPGEAIPLPDNSVDTVLLTYTLCTIPDWLLALQQMRRVLKPAGQLLFCEHGQAPDAGVQRWQDRLNPAWRKLMGGCNLNRPIPECLAQAGFIIDKLEQFYLPKAPRFAGYMSMGVASLPAE